MSVAPPRIVSRAEIEHVLPEVDLVAAMEAAFVDYSEGRAVVPPVGELLFAEPPGDAHIKYGYLTGDEVFVIKVATGFYDNPARGLPAGSGLMLVFDARNGLLRAVLLDEGHLTDVRTAAAGAAAARHLMPRAVEAIGVLGAGRQARLQVEMLGSETPVRDVTIWARRPAAAQACSADLGERGFRASLAATPAEVARGANLIVTATASQAPLLRAGDVRPGTHITAVGSDTEGKQELDAALLAAADRVIGDSLAQCRDRGEIHQALKRGRIEATRLVELGAVIAGRSPGRQSERDITIADLTGVAVQDIAIAKAVLARLS